MEVLITITSYYTGEEDLAYGDNTPPPPKKLSDDPTPD